MPGIKEIKISTLLLYFLLSTTLVSCQKEGNSNFKKISKLSNVLSEISGITSLSNHKLYAINDSGNDPILFCLNQQGEILSELKIPESKNKDWEDLAYDTNGNVYIGDFGNNYNDRKDLTIYKVSGILSDRISTSKIEFIFEDQKKFPPKKRNFNFDVEAFICLNENLYLFTKDRSTNEVKTTKIYKIPSTPGKHIAKAVGQYEICKKSSGCSITAAAINRSQDKIALLTSNKIFLLKDFDKEDPFTQKLRKIKLNHFSQKESLCFINDTTLLISDEKSRYTKGNLYRYTIK